MSADPLVAQIECYRQQQAIYSERSRMTPDALLDQLVEETYGPPHADLFDNPQRPVSIEGAVYALDFLTEDDELGNVGSDNVLRQIAAFLRPNAVRIETEGVR